MLELPTFVSESDRQNSSSRAPSAIAPPTTVRTPSSPSSDRRPGAYAMLVRTPSSLHLRRPLRRRAPFPSHRRLSFPKVPVRRRGDGSPRGQVHPACPLYLWKARGGRGPVSELHTFVSESSLRPRGPFARIHRPRAASTLRPRSRGSSRSSVRSPIATVRSPRSSTRPPKHRRSPGRLRSTVNSPPKYPPPAVATLSRSVRPFAPATVGRVVVFYTTESHLSTIGTGAVVEDQSQN